MPWIRTITLILWFSVPAWILLFSGMGFTAEALIGGLIFGVFCISWGSVRGSRWMLKSLGAKSMKLPELQKTVRAAVWASKDAKLIHADGLRLYQFSEVTQQALLFKPFFGKPILVLSSGLLLGKNPDELSAIVVHATRLSLSKEVGLCTASAALMSRVLSPFRGRTFNWMETLMGSRTHDQKQRKLENSFSALAVCILVFWNSVVRAVGIPKRFKMDVSLSSAARGSFGWGSGFQMGIAELGFFAPHTGPTQDLLSWSSR